MLVKEAGVKEIIIHQNSHGKMFSVYSLDTLPGGICRLVANAIIVLNLITQIQYCVAESGYHYFSVKTAYDEARFRGEWPSFQGEYRKNSKSGIFR